MRDIRSDQFALFFLTLTILWTFFIIFNFVLFFKNRQSIYIRNRDPWLIFCSAIGQYLMMFSLTYKIVVLREHFPNMLDHWFLWGFIPLHFLPYPVRSMRFIIQSAYNRYQYKRLKDKDEKANPFFDFLQKHPSLRQDMAYFILNWILMAIAIAWGLYRNIALPINHPGEYGFINTKTYYISCIALLVVASFFLWLAVYFLRKTGEELYVTVELITIGILWLIFISLYVAFSWKDIGTFRTASILLIVLCISSFCVSFGMPVQLAVVVKKYAYSEENLQSVDRTRSEVNFAQSILNNDENEFNSQQKKTQDIPIDYEGIVKNKYKRLENIMNDPVCYDLLVEFCQNKMCIEYILFYKDVSEYKKLKDDELSPKFEEIKEKYVKDDAPFHINIMVSVLREVENTTEPNKKTFDKMVSKVDYLVKVEVFPPFKQSPAMQKFIDNKVKDAEKKGLSPNQI